MPAIKIKIVMIGKIGKNTSLERYAMTKNGLCRVQFVLKVVHIPQRQIFSCPLLTLRQFIQMIMINYSHVLCVYMECEVIFE